MMDFNDEQKKALRELVKTNEQFKCPRVIIDYAIQFALEFMELSQHSKMRKAMETYVEELYATEFPLEEIEP